MGGGGGPNRGTFLALNKRIFDDVIKGICCPKIKKKKSSAVECNVFGAEHNLSVFLKIAS